MIECTFSFFSRYSVHSEKENVQVVLPFNCLMLRLAIAIDFLVSRINCILDVSTILDAS